LNNTGTITIVIEPYLTNALEYNKHRIG